MITLITGTPGAGKTLYAVSKLLRELVGTVIQSKDDSGHDIEVPRVIYTNINRLTLDHELIDGRDGGGLADWHKWAKPGAVICFDEVQREWPPRPNGSKIPDWISALETHRHMGVDFIILTQNPMLLDQNVRALVGRHVHIRRVGGGMGAAIAYEWDHCNRQLLFSKALAKSPIKYDKKAFDLYKSAELHTGAKPRIPPLVYFVALAVIGAAIAIPYGLMRSKPPASVEQPAPATDQGKTPSNPVPGQARPMASSGQGVKPPDGYDWAAFVPRVSHEPWSAPAYDEIRKVVSMPRIEGSLCVNDQCKCMTQQRTVALEGDQCRQWVEHRPFDPYKPDDDGSRVMASAAVPSDPLPRQSGLPKLDIEGMLGGK